MSTDFVYCVLSSIPYERDSVEKAFYTREAAIDWIEEQKETHREGFLYIEQIEVSK